MKEGIYDYEERLERYRRIIAGFGANGEIALRLLDHLTSLGLSIARVSKIASHIPALLRVIDFDLRSATRADVERVVAWINRNPRYREWTKHDKKMVLRKLIQYAKYGRCDGGTPVPPEVSWIKLTVKGRDARATPEALLTHEDFEAMVKAADNPRDRAMLHVLFEAALRPGELLGMSVGSVEFKKDYCIITVNGKTGVKRIPLVASYMPLLDWLKAHPRRDEPSAPLWCSLATNYAGERLSYRHFRLILRRIAERAGVKKSVWPYLFRHTALTRLAKVFTEAQLEQYAGWVHGSKMSARYVHFSARDLEEAVLALYGLREHDGRGPAVKAVMCPRCRSANPATSYFCSQCGFALKLEAAYRAEESAKTLVEKAEELDALRRALKEREEAIGDLRREIDALKSLVMRMLNGGGQR